MTLAVFAMYEAGESLRIGVEPAREPIVHHVVRKLPVYRDALAFSVAIDELAEALPSYRGYLKNQLRRASLSILLNITEGATETEPREKARMYRLAKRSAAETAAGLDFTGRVVPLARAAADKLDRLAGSLVTQLHHMIADQLRRATKPSTPRRRSTPVRPPRPQ